MSPTTCPKCGRPVETIDDEPEKYGRLAAIIAGGSG